MRNYESCDRFYSPDFRLQVLVWWVGTTVSEKYIRSPFSVCRKIESGCNSEDMAPSNQNKRSYSLQKYRNITQSQNLVPLKFDIFFNMAQQPPSGPRPPICRGLMIVLRHTTVGRNSLDARSAQHTEFRQHATFVRDRHPCARAGFEPTIPTNERPQTHTLDRAATKIGHICIW